jgi:hypothetical protein
MDVSFYRFTWIVFVFNYALYGMRIIPIPTLILYQNIAIVIACLYAGWEAIQVARLYDASDKIRSVWILFGVGIASYGVGETFYLWYEGILGELDVFPTVGDLFIVAGYGCYLVAYARVLILSRQFYLFPPGHRVLFSIGVIGVSYGLALYFLILPTLLAAEGALANRLLSQMYPVMDLVEIALCVRLLTLFSFFGSARTARPWLILCGASLLSLVVDLLYSTFFFVDDMGLYFWINPLFLAVYCLMGIAFQKQKELMADCADPTTFFSRI